MRPAASGAIASTSTSTADRSPATSPTPNVVDRRPRPARTRLQPPRAGGAGRHRPSSLPRPAACRRSPRRSGSRWAPPSRACTGRSERCERRSTPTPDPGPDLVEGRLGMTAERRLRTRPSPTGSTRRPSTACPTTSTRSCARTTRTRQRPAWSSLERWLPVQTTLRLAPVPGSPGCSSCSPSSSPLGVAVLAVGLASARAPAAVRARPERRRSCTARTTATSIVVDPVSGAATALIAGIDEATAVPWLLAATGPGSCSCATRHPTPPRSARRATIMVADADGTDVRPTDRPGLDGSQDVAWSP